jgi:hypothetical protein
MEAANVAFAVDPEIIIGREKLAPDEAADRGGERPQEGDERRILVPADLHSRLVHQVELPGEVLEAVIGGFQVRFDAFQKRLDDFRREQLLGNGIALRVVIAVYFHARATMPAAGRRQCTRARNGAVAIFLRFGPGRV